MMMMMMMMGGVSRSGEKCNVLTKR